MPNIVIQGSTTAFPDSGTPADWSQPVIDFATDVQNALSGLVGAADVSPQTFDISNFNGVSLQPVPALTFSTAIVRSAVIEYSISRSTSSQSDAEVGTLRIEYNVNNATNAKWDIMRMSTGNNTANQPTAGQSTTTGFQVSDAGQVSFTNTALTGTGHTGKISFSAKSLLQS